MRSTDTPTTLDVVAEVYRPPVGGDAHGRWDFAALLGSTEARTGVHGSQLFPFDIDGRRLSLIAAEHDARIVRVVAHADGFDRAILMHVHVEESAKRRAS